MQLLMRVALCWFSHSENRRSVTPPGSEDDHKGSWRLGGGFVATWWVHRPIRPSAYLDRLLALVPAANFSDLACQPSRSSQTLPQHHASRHRQARQQRLSNPLALPTRISQRVDCDRLIFRRRFSTCRDNAGGIGSSIAPLGGLRPGKKWRNLPSAKPSTDTRATLHPSRPPVLSISRLFFSACHFRRLRFLHHSRDNRDFSPSPDSHRSLDFFASLSPSSS